MKALCVGNRTERPMYFFFQLHETKYKNKCNIQEYLAMYN